MREPSIRSANGHTQDEVKFLIEWRSVGWEFLPGVDLQTAQALVKPSPSPSPDKALARTKLICSVPFWIAGSFTYSSQPNPIPSTQVK